MSKDATISEGPRSTEAGTGRPITREHVIDLVAMVGLVFLMIIAVRTTIRLDRLISLLVLAVVVPHRTDAPSIGCTHRRWCGRSVGTALHVCRHRRHRLGGVEGHHQPGDTARVDAG